MEETVTANSDFSLDLLPSTDSRRSEQIVLVNRTELLVSLRLVDLDSMRLSLSFSNLEADIHLLVNVGSESFPLRFCRRLLFSPECPAFELSHKYVIPNQIGDVVVPIGDVVDTFAIRISIRTRLFSGLLRGPNEKTGYLSSILQCVYHLPSVRSVISSIDGVLPLWARNLCLLFARMQLQRISVDTTPLTDSFYSSLSDDRIQRLSVNFSHREIARDPLEFWLFLKNRLIAETTAGAKFNSLFAGVYTFVCVCAEVEKEYSVAEPRDYLLLNVDGCAGLTETFTKFRETVRVVGGSPCRKPRTRNTYYDATKTLDKAELPVLLFLGFRGVMCDSFSFPDAFDGKLLKGDGPYTLRGVIARSVSGDDHYIACLLTASGEWYHFNDTAATPFPTHTNISREFEKTRGLLGSVGFVPHLLIYFRADAEDVRVSDEEVQKFVEGQLGFPSVQVVRPRERLESVVQPELIGALPFPDEETPLDAVLRELDKSSFFERIRTWMSRPPGRPRYVIGRDCVDFRLMLENGAVIPGMHQCVLGTCSHFFSDLFQFLGGSQGEVVEFHTQFPFSGVLLDLMNFFYVMTIPGLDLDEFLSGVSFGCFFSHIVLFSALSYLDEYNLIFRVRARLSQRWPSSSAGSFAIVHSFISQILERFPLDGPPFVIDAIGRMRIRLEYLSTHWDDAPSVPPFVNPFAKRLPPSADSLFLKTQPPFVYGSLQNLEAFLKSCVKGRVDWIRGYFPPRNPEAPRIKLEEAGVKRYVIQPWYPHFYDWAFHMDDHYGSQHVVLGNPGIGKSVFGLYFMARLIAARLPFFYGHDYFLFSWRPAGSEDGKRYSARISLTGEVMPISEDEFQKEQRQKNGPFRLVDGWCCSLEWCYPVLAIPSSPQTTSWKVDAVFRYAPALAPEQYNLFSDVSTRYPFEGDAALTHGCSVEEFGNLRMRFQIAGDNLRLVFGRRNLRGLRDFLLVGQKQPAHNQGM
jgi:hypothetical protein